MRWHRSRCAAKRSPYFDAIYKRFDRLESEYQTLKAAVRRIEDKLES